MVKCLICNKEFERITTSHLWIKHKIIMKDYKEKFPGAEIGKGSFEEMFKDYPKKINA